MGIFLYLILASWVVWSLARARRRRRLRRDCELMRRVVNRYALRFPEEE